MKYCDKERVVKYEGRWRWAAHQWDDAEVWVWTDRQQVSVENENIPDWTNWTGDSEYTDD